MSNEVLGRITCSNGGRGVVMQTKRKGKHLYMRCDCCGLDQRTGAKVQQWMWDNAEWMGTPPSAPVNVNTEQKQEAKPEPKPEPKQSEDFDPEAEMDQTEEKPSSKPKGLLVPVVAGLGVVGFIAAVLKA